MASSTSSNDEVSPARRRSDVGAGPALRPPTGDEVLDYLISHWGSLLGKRETLPRWLATTREACPAVDLLSEAKKAAAWELSRPANKKKQVRAFLTRWWGRQQDRGGTRGQSDQGADEAALEAARKLGAQL